MFDTSMSWLMTDLNRDPPMVSAVQVATTLPMFLLTLPAGAPTEIVDPRRLLIVAQFVYADFGMFCSAGHNSTREPAPPHFFRSRAPTGHFSHCIGRPHPAA